METSNRSSSSLDYVRAFIAGAERVLSELLGETPTKGAPAFMADASFAMNEVNVGVGVTGSLRGQVNFGLTMKTALAIASTMMMEEVTELDEMSKSALQELGNMISGNARSFLQELGEVTDITPPTIVVGDHMVATWHQIRAMSVKIVVSQGEISLTVGIRKQD